MEADAEGVLHDVPVLETDKAPSGEASRGNIISGLVVVAIIIVVVSCCGW